MRSEATSRTLSALALAAVRTTSIARIENQDAQDRAATLEAEEASEREEHEAMVRETELEQERENQAQPGGPNPRVESQSDGQRTTPAKLTWWFSRPRDPKAMKWGGSGNVSRSAVRTAYPDGNPPLKGCSERNSLANSKHSYGAVNLMLRALPASLTFSGEE